VTLFGIFLTPVFYSVVRRLSDRKTVKPALADGPDVAPAGTILYVAAAPTQGDSDTRRHDDSRTSPSPGRDQ
jgi:hypothetical protein